MNDTTKAIRELVTLALLGLLALLSGCSALRRPPPATSALDLRLPPDRCHALDDRQAALAGWATGAAAAGAGLGAGGALAGLVAEDRRALLWLSASGLFVGALATGLAQWQAATVSSYEATCVGLSAEPP